MFNLKIKDHCGLFQDSMILPYILKVIRCLGKTFWDNVNYDGTFDLKIKLTPLIYISWFSHFALLLEDHVVNEGHCFR